MFNMMHKQEFLKNDCLHKPKSVPALIVDPREKQICLLQRENFVKLFKFKQHASVATTGHGMLCPYRKQQ